VDVVERRNAHALFDDLDRDAAVLAGGARAHDRPQRARDPAAAADHLADVVGRDVEQERGLPKVIDGSRRQRIAHGSGTTVEEVNRLMDARKQMEKLMKGMSRGKMPDLGALTGAGAAPSDMQPRRKATKSNKKKKRSKTRR